MKIQTYMLAEIQYDYVPYPDALKQSLARMGQGFPIQAKRLEDGSLCCIDGHKRLSAIADLLQELPDHKMKQINVLILNSARTPSGTAKNHH